MAKQYDHAQAAQEFKDAVNMTAGELTKWLATDESKSVGVTDEDDTESVGHKSGQRIIKILKIREADLMDDDYAHMRKVVGYVARHTKQRPAGDVSSTRWRFSLMNWGHDPLKDTG